MKKKIIVLVGLIASIFFIFNFKYIYKLNKENDQIKDIIGNEIAEDYYSLINYCKEMNIHLAKLLSSNEFQKEDLKEFMDRHTYTYDTSQYYEYFGCFWSIKSAVSDICKLDSLSEKDVEYIKNVINFNRKIDDIHSEIFEKYKKSNIFDNAIFYEGEIFNEFMRKVKVASSKQNLDYSPFKDEENKEVLEENIEKVKHQISRKEFLDQSKKVASKIFGHEIYLKNEWSNSSNNQTYDFQYEPLYVLGIGFDDVYGMVIVSKESHEELLKLSGKRISEEQIDKRAAEFINSIEFENLYLFDKTFFYDHKGGINRISYHYAKKVGEVYDLTRTIHIMLKADGQLCLFRINNLDFMSDETNIDPKFTINQVLENINKEYIDKIEKISILRDLNRKYIYEIIIVIGEERFVYKLSGDTGHLLDITFYETLK